MDHRRFPHLTRADVELLDELRAARGPEAAREFERLLQAQHRDAERHAARHVLTDDLDRDLAAQRRARA